MTRQSRQRRADFMGDGRRELSDGGQALNPRCRPLGGGEQLIRVRQLLILLVQLFRGFSQCDIGLLAVRTVFDDHRQACGGAVAASHNKGVGTDRHPLFSLREIFEFIFNGLARCYELSPFRFFVGLMLGRDQVSMSDRQKFFAGISAEKFQGAIHLDKGALERHVRESVVR